MPTAFDYRPRIGVIALAYAGYNLGEQMCGPKMAEILAWLKPEKLDLHVAESLVLDSTSARQAGDQLARQKVDCILAVFTTFVPDYWLVELLQQCDVPIFLYAVEREMQCLSLVCGPMITATLYNLGKHYQLRGADIPDEAIKGHLLKFARAAMMRRVLRTMRVGYCGGKPPIMFSMAVDEYLLQAKLGVTVIQVPVEEFNHQAQSLPDVDVARHWASLCTQVGQVQVVEQDGLISSRYTLAAQALVQTYQLNALSLNCFPALKSRICLTMACLNDAGIGAACEGDLHSTILMQLLETVSGGAAFNGDFLRIYPQSNEVLFSHCGGGAFSLARSRNEIVLQSSIETLDGAAVLYPTRAVGPVTLINLMYGCGDLRLAAMCGQAVDTDLEYQGTPLRLRFQDGAQALLQRIATYGAGHHWNGGEGDYMVEFETLCQFTGIKCNAITRCDAA